MTFCLRLNTPNGRPALTLPDAEYDPEFDDIGSILRDICEALDDEGATFLVRICTGETWPVTVRTDLVMVMEQLPAVLAALAENQPATLGFYEQGVERIISLLPSGAETIIESRDVIPARDSSVMSCRHSRQAVVDELVNLVDTFLFASSSCRSLSIHPWFSDYSSQLTSQVNRLTGLRAG